MSNSCDQDALHDIQRLYTELALHPEKDFDWKTGKENAVELGYKNEWLQWIPDNVWSSSAAVGNPFSLHPIRPGESVIDLGCGAGVDVCIAARLTGAHGFATGVDVTLAMADKARANCMLLKQKNTLILHADITNLPINDNSFDAVISNGSINLASNKKRVFSEMYRILRPGGRIQIADMIRIDDTVKDTCEGDHSWANCVAGTLSAQHYIEQLRHAGFENPQLVSFTGYQTSPVTMGALIAGWKN